jgi:hypothetical protein
LALYKKAELMTERGHHQVGSELFLTQKLFFSFLSKSALDILDKLLELTPQEPSIYLLKGKVYKKLGLTDKYNYY